MQHPGLTVVIIIPLQKEGIPQGLQLLLWFLFFSCRNPIFVSYGGTCMPFASKANALAVPNCLWNTAKDSFLVLYSISPPWFLIYCTYSAFTPQNWIGLIDVGLLM
jgi:hypothetical protein